MFKKLIILSMLLLQACTHQTQAEKDAKRVLTDYIYKSFRVVSDDDQEVLAGFLTGELKRKLMNLSEKEFTNEYIGTGIKLTEFKIEETRPISPEEIQITFQVAFQGKITGSTDLSSQAKMTHLKMAQLSFVDGRWRISEIQNIRENVEYKDPIKIAK